MSFPLELSFLVLSFLSALLFPDLVSQKCYLQQNTTTYYRNHNHLFHFDSKYHDFHHQTIDNQKHYWNNRIVIPYHGNIPKLHYHLYLCHLYNKDHHLSDYNPMDISVLSFLSALLFLVYWKHPHPLRSPELLFPSHSSQVYQYPAYRYPVYRYPVCRIQAYRYPVYLFPVCRIQAYLFPAYLFPLEMLFPELLFRFHNTMHFPVQLAIDAQLVQPHNKYLSLPHHTKICRHHHFRNRTL